MLLVSVDISVSVPKITSYYNSFKIISQSVCQLLCKLHAHCLLHGPDIKPLCYLMTSGAAGLQLILLPSLSYILPLQGLFVYEVCIMDCAAHTD